YRGRLARRAANLRSRFPARLMALEINHPAAGDVDQQRVGFDITGQPAEALKVGPQLIESFGWCGIQRGEGAGADDAVSLQRVVHLEAFECVDQSRAVTVG